MKRWDEYEKEKGVAGGPSWFAQRLWKGDVMPKIINGEEMSERIGTE